MIDWDKIALHMREVADDVHGAWERLLTALEPALVAMVRNEKLGRLLSLTDTPHDVALMVIDKLHGDDHKVIRQLFASDSPPSVRSWLRVVVRRAAIDYMRARPDFHRGSKERDAKWATIKTLTTSVGREPDDTLIARRRTVLADLEDAVRTAKSRHAELGDAAFHALALEWQVPKLFVRRLVNKGDIFVPLLNHLFQGRRYAEIAELLGVSRREVELSLGYIEQFLETRYRAKDS